MKCLESEDESTTVTTETFYQLSCFIEKGLTSLSFLSEDVLLLDAACCRWYVGITFCQPPCWLHAVQTCE